MARRIDTDVLIIGSGALGATYARLLAGGGRKITMIASGAQMPRRPGEHLLNAFVYQHQPNLALALMYSQNHLLSIPQEPYKLEVPSGPLYNPPVPRTNWANPRQNPNFNMPNAATAQVVGGAFRACAASRPMPQPFERPPLGRAARLAEAARRRGHGRQPIHDDGVDPDAARAQCLERIARFLDRHGLGERDPRHRGPGRVAQERADVR